MRNIKTIISKLVSERQERGLSQAELSELCGVSQPVIARMESGVNTPNLDTLLKISNALGLEVTLENDESTEILDSYDFKRAAYYDIEKSIAKNNITFVLGPRKCGKTICLTQLYNTLENTEYYDAKQYTEDENNRFCKRIVESVSKGQKKIFLIDEITNLPNPQIFLNTLGYTFTTREVPTRIVVTGSQSIALKSWGMGAFANNAEYIYMDFLDYPEWLAYKNINEVSSDTYKAFVQGTKEFYKDFKGTKEYIEASLDETIKSNDKTKDLIRHNRCDGLSDDFLTDIMFATLAVLNKHVTSSTFVKKSNIFDELNFAYPEQVQNLSKEEVLARIEHIAENKYENLKKFKPYLLIRGLRFLYNCNLIGITLVTDNLDMPVPYDIFKYLSEKYDDNGYPVNENRMNMFENINFYIKYPMFYAEIIKEVLGEEYKELHPMIFGDMVECHIRGMLDDRRGVEYRDDEDREIDYVNLDKKIAIEISTFNKKNNATHFNVLDESFDKILTTLDKKGKDDSGITRIPYADMIFGLSKGKILIQKKNTNDKSKENIADDIKGNGGTEGYVPEVIAKSKPVIKANRCKSITDD